MFTDCNLKKNSIFLHFNRPSELHTVDTELLILYNFLGFSIPPKILAIAIKIQSYTFLTNIRFHFLLNISIFKRQILIDRGLTGLGPTYSKPLENDLHFIA